MDAHRVFAEFDDAGGAGERKQAPAAPAAAVGGNGLAPALGASTNAVTELRRALPHPRAAGAIAAMPLVDVLELLSSFTQGHISLSVGETGASSVYPGGGCVHVSHTVVVVCQCHALHAHGVLKGGYWPFWAAVVDCMPCTHPP